MCNQLKDTNVFAAYEKAIEGYQFQVGRYNTWMNYYAIFVGALFIALYSICTGKGLVIDAEEVKYLLLLISFIGWIASLCWYGSLLGYRKWHSHWMMVVHQIEKTISSKENSLDSYPLVYRNMPESDRSHSAARYEPGYLSTQKITGTFIFFVALAWATVFGYTIYCCADSLCAGISAGAIAGIVTLLIWILLHYVGCRAYCSTIPKD